MNRMIVLLRGINVSGHNKVPMAELRSALTEAGFDGVATYIQSGNIAVDTDQPADAVTTSVEAILDEQFNVSVPAVAIPQANIAELLESAPFPTDADPAINLIYFPQGAIDIAGIEALDPEAHPGDSITATNAAVYVAYGQGQSKSKLTVDKLERAAGTTLTGRNLRTAAKLTTL